MKTSLMHRLHIGVLSLSSLWAVLCLVAPPVDDGMYIAMAIGPLVSYAIGALLITQMRRDISPL